MNSIQYSFRLVWLVSVFLILAMGCKSTKKTASVKNPADDKARMEQEAKLRQQKEDELKGKTGEQRAMMDAKSVMKEMNSSAPKVRLNEYFAAISASDNVASANSTINEALSMFASPETPVLIVISEEEGKKDYDKPTTIRAYLNYLKDQKKNVNDIENVIVNDSGKITEVELRKLY